VQTKHAKAKAMVKIEFPLRVIRPKVTLTRFPVNDASPLNKGNCFHMLEFTDQSLVAAFFAMSDISLDQPLPILFTTLLVAYA